MIGIRRGQGPGKLDRVEFSRRFQARFVSPKYDPERESIARLEDIAWEAYQDSEKAPRTRPAGSEFKDPKYELSLDWLETRAQLQRAARIHDDPGSPPRVLVISGSARNEDTCPSEMAKSYRLAALVRDTLTELGGWEVDFLDLSLLGSEYGRQIHPCKACVSTAMPLCHWPCSCYPSHSLGQVDDWMAEIYERWTRAHGVIIVTPVYWYQAPSGLKLMIDRLVCADGGNLDPTSTSGKDPKKAKKLELDGWPYPQHLAGRAYGVIVHGDVAGTEELRRALCDWLEGMGLVECGAKAKLDRYIGYFEPYATSHAALDKDRSIQEEARNVALAVADKVRALRRGDKPSSDAGLMTPRPK